MSCWKGRHSTVDLLVLTSRDQLIFILNILFSFFYKTSCLNEEGNCTELSPSESIPWMIPCKLIGLVSFLHVRRGYSWVNPGWAPLWQFPTQVRLAPLLDNTEKITYAELLSKVRLNCALRGHSFKLICEPCLLTKSYLGRAFSAL
jgi:hypothetical protein